MKAGVTLVFICWQKQPQPLMQAPCLDSLPRSTWRSLVLAVAVTLGGGLGLVASEMITNSAIALASLQSGNGGTLMMDFDGVITVSQTLVINTNTTVDATGHSVTLDGANIARHFAVTNGVTLRLVHLKLING